MLRIAPAFSGLAIAFLFASLPAHAVDINASADTFVDGANTTTRAQNFGSSRTIRVRNSGQRIALVRFTGLPSTAPARAELILHVDTVNVAGLVGAARIRSPWSESTVTFNSRPTIEAGTSLGQHLVNSTYVGSTISFDVTGLVREWIANPSSNFGVAIRASVGSPAQAYFASREGGIAPRLRLVSASDNEVTVAPTGADYTSPATAANNAYDGDRWCVNPTDTAPCRIVIGSGFYFLDQIMFIPSRVTVSGSGITETTIVGSPTVPAAVQMDSRTEIRDLSVLHRAPTGDQVRGFFASGLEMPGPVLRRVAVHVTGGTLRTVGIEMLSENASLILTDSIITVRGPRESTGIDGVDGADLSVTRSKIAVHGGSHQNIGILVSNVAQPLGVRVEDVDVIAEGGEFAGGIGLGNSNGSGGGAVSVTRGSISARASINSFGIAIGGAEYVVNGSTVVAEGGSSGIGVLVTGSASGVLQDMRAHGSLRGMSLGGAVAVRGSRLTSAGTALHVGNTASQLSALVEQSILEGPVAIQINTGETPQSFTMRSSIFAGQRIIPAGHTCQQVYDETYQQLNAQCQ